MRQSFLFAVGWASVATAHGHVKEYIIDEQLTLPLILLTIMNPSSISSALNGGSELRTDIGPGVGPG